MNRLKISVCALLCLLSLRNVNAQESVLTKYQDSLVRISNEVLQSKDDSKRVEANARFVKTLVNALKIPYSYNFSFSQVKNMSVTVAPDNHFRIFSWFLPLNDGTYRYYGSIQLSTVNGKLSLIPLSDRTDEIQNKQAELSAKEWYGARYYDILPVQNAQGNYYALMGWKGRNDKVTERVIEVLSFEDMMPVFGKNVFDGVKGRTQNNRIIFAYNKFNSMLLQFDKNVNLIVFDHLAPMDPAKKNDPQFYASDSSFDGYKIVNGRLKLMENVELLNPPNATDALYNDPKSFKPPVIN